MCGVVSRRQVWRRIREDKIDLKMVEVVGEEWVVDVAEAGTQETAVRAALGRVLGMVRGKALVDRSSGSGLALLHVWRDGSPACSSAV